jgi:hypothetical protein
VKEKKLLSRRSFLKGATVTGAGIIVAACAPQPTETPPATEKPAEEPAEPAAAEAIELDVWTG